jgi:hypothetical protein
MDILNFTSLNCVSKLTLFENCCLVLCFSRRYRNRPLLGLKKQNENYVSSVFVFTKVCQSMNHCYHLIVKGLAKPWLALSIYIAFYYLHLNSINILCYRTFISVSSQTNKTSSFSERQTRGVFFFDLMVDRFNFFQKWRKWRCWSGKVFGVVQDNFKFKLTKINRFCTALFRKNQLRTVHNRE